MTQTQQFNTGGGAVIGGDANTHSGDVVLRDKIINIYYADDGQRTTEADTIEAPLEHFDPSLLQHLDAPGGAVRLRDTFYVSRPADDALRQEMVKWGTTTTVRAPRQTGRTSLLVRAIQAAKAAGSQAVFLDFQALEEEYFENAGDFLRCLAETVCRELRLEVEDELQRRWQRPGGDQNKLTYFLEDVILPHCANPLTLVMDEADHLLEKTTFYTDFFGLVRSWHNRRASHPEQWEKLNIVLSISTEPYLLIRDMTQSPFNVGLRLTLEDFDMAQVGILNQQHGLPIAPEELLKLQELLGGHPYLTRQALYSLVKGQIDWPTLVNKATSEQELFGSHLRRQYELIRRQADLSNGLRQVVQTGQCSDEDVRFRLLRSGLIHETDEGYRCRCGLYQRYFMEKYG